MSVFVWPVFHPSLRRKRCTFLAFSRLLRTSSLVPSQATQHWCGTQSFLLLLYHYLWKENHFLHLHNQYDSPLTGGLGKSTTISECEVAPTFCTNLTVNTRLQEKRVSLLSALIMCMTCQWTYSFSLLFSWRCSGEADTRPEGWDHGLHLPLSEPLLLPSRLWSYAIESIKSLQVGHVTSCNH